jgi:site-specific recombinase XerD
MLIKKGRFGKLGLTIPHKFRFHDLRQTFASHLIMRGAGLKTVQELLGHSDIKMTMRYAHLFPGHLQESVNLLNNLAANPA